jgi:hypothetical protein
MPTRLHSCTFRQKPPGRSLASLEVRGASAPSHFTGAPVPTPSIWAGGSRWLGLHGA